ncbi:peptidase S8 [Paenibacillus anaericanus]|uniref:Peptidase S8 n=1 Tax=Paenibacillus anaericanus TaxID=170367 RepID=A0A3S1DHK8_9BACL|nr:S8 family peptidase [Paenibacillus anaericanus]RUT41336.1 peptidase S8 [Paenibacillus anaericanus]
MDYSVFLQYLNGHINTSGTSGRYIIRFPHPAQYNECLRQLHRLRRKLPALKRVRTSSLLRAFLCPLGLPDKVTRNRFGVLVEEDSIVSVHSASPGKERSAEIPWGVRRIDAPEAWSLSTGSQIRIGVIDTGVDYSHPDLRYSLARGINLLNRVSLPHDDNGHGTHISGTIAASGGSQGIIGVAPRSLIYPVKAFDHNGSAYVSDIILGIDWCVRNHMHIVNMSFGMKNKSVSLQNIIRKAHEAGIIVVASSGNDKKSRSVDYPARYSQTISVGATGKNGRIAPFSNHGSYIDIYAPGEKIYSCWLGGGHREMSGTSMATSHVSGAIALLLSLRPGMTPDQVKRRIRRNARALPANSPLAKAGTGEAHASRLLRGKTKKLTSS